MTQDEIMEMWNSITKYAPSEVRIAEFAKLVAAKERERICKQIAVLHDSLSLASTAAIRARGEA